MAARLAASVITSQRQSWALLAVGACMASRTQSRITSRSTGLVTSRRLRTARVVVSNSSTEAMSTGRSDVDRAGLVDAEHGQGAAETKENRNAQREVEDLCVGEQFAQAADERVLDRGMVSGKALGVLDGKSLPRRVARVGGICRDVVVQLWSDAGLEHRRCAKPGTGDAVVDLRDAH